MPSSVVEAFSVTHAQVLDGTMSFLDAALATATDDDLDVYGVDEASLSPDMGKWENEGDDAVLSRWNWLNFANVAIKGGFLSMPLLSFITKRPIDVLNAVAASVNEMQTITLGAPTAGTYVLVWGGQRTTDLPFDATIAQIQSALEALPAIGVGNVLVAGTAAVPTVTFQNRLAGQDVELIQVDSSALTPANAATVAETTAGVSAHDAAFGMDLWHEDDANTATLPGIIRMPSKDKYGAVRRLTIGLYAMQFEPVGLDGPKYKNGLKVSMNAVALKSAVDELGQPFPDGKRRVGRLLSHI